MANDSGNNPRQAAVFASREPCGPDSDHIGRGFIAVLCRFTAVEFTVLLKQFRNSS